MNIFPPPPLISAAIGSALLIPAFLVLLRWGPRGMRQLGCRYRTSVAVGWLAFFFTALVVTRGQPAPLLDWLAGVAVLLGMTLIAFNAWTIIAYGITFNMILALARSDRPLNLEAWADCYSGGRSIEQICCDRLQHLFLLRLAHAQGDMVQLAPWTARAVIILLGPIYFLFGVKRVS